ncbi:MAG: VCBS repeat-containing protein [Candidatus Eisenbacteria bacterium]|nr:VCBS repeat-containing protein [Candidatus Eisenbacteria bacterium]
MAEISFRLATTCSRPDRRSGEFAGTRALRLLSLLILPLLLLTAYGCGEGNTPGDEAAPVSGNKEQLDPQSLEWIEDLSESLANDLLDLSVSTRRRNAAEIRGYLSESMEATPWPDGSRPMPEGVTLRPVDPALAATNPDVGSARYVRKWDWPLATATQTSGDDYLDNWTGFLDRYSEVEDVRFKVKKAAFESETSGTARLFFFLIGRNSEGNREWLSVWADAAVARADADSSRWQLSRFALESVTSVVAERDLFSEVSKPAGVALHLPRYGAPGNEGFVWHGAAAGDIDNDGDIDLVVAGVERNYVYLNRGDGTFDETAGACGIAETPESVVAPLLLDYDSDGDSDLFCSASGLQMLFENRLVPDGKLAFRDVSLHAGVDRPAIGFSAVSADVNADGHPDILVNSYQRYGVIMPNGWHDADNGTPNLLFINRGDGTFTEEAAQWGIADSRWSYAAEFIDFDGDNDLDVYIANDFGTNGFYRNDGDHFTDIAEELGLSDPGNGMGVSFGDFDNDGDLDLHVTNMSSTAGNRILGRLYGDAAPTGKTLRKLAAGNSLYERMPDGSWKNVTSDVGGFSAGWAWGGGFFDADNDGWEDLFTTNGFVSGKLMKDT